MQATRPLPPLKRASPAAPAASAARREASAQTASTPAPLETSSAIATSGEPLPRDHRPLPGVAHLSDHAAQMRHVAVGEARSRRSSASKRSHHSASSHSQA